ncbi:hypothetical protein NQL31_005622 [Lotmaria passim]
MAYIASSSARTPALSRSDASRRRYPPCACAFNPTCTVAVVSTIVGVRPFELFDRSATGPSHSPIAQSLLPSQQQQQQQQLSPDYTRQPYAAVAATTDAAAPFYHKAPPDFPLHALWNTPVYVATVAGESALVAVVFRARPAVFAPATHTMGESTEKPLPRPAPGVTQTSAEQDTSANEDEGITFAASAAADDDEDDDAVQADEYHDEEDGEGVEGASNPIAAEGAQHSFPVPSSVVTGTVSSPFAAATPSNSALFATEAEYRRYVYLFDATTGFCLAALHFCGSPVVALRANAAVLLVAATDLFHIVELDTLRYVRQQSMCTPPNPRSVLDLSAAVPMKVRRAASENSAVPSTRQPEQVLPSFTYAIAFPQSARGYRGDVTVLTLRTKTAQPASGGHPDTTATEAAAAAPSMLQRTISAHHHALAHLRLRQDGRLLLTASQLGTTLKLFDCVSGALLVELQRGHRPASVLSLGLQQDAYRVAALSANGTLHVFNCAAVVQLWEAGRRWTAAQAPAAAAALSRNKARADFKLKVDPLHRKDSRGVVAGVKCSSSSNQISHLNTSAFSSYSAVVGGPEAAPLVELSGDGSVQHDVGFAVDGRTVWVAQVESTETQLAFTKLQAGAGAATATAHGKPFKRCIGKLTRFSVQPLGPAGAANADVEGENYSIEI